MKPISISYGLGVTDHDSEGRLVTVEFDNFYLLCSYVPNSGDGLRRLVYYALPTIECVMSCEKLVARVYDYDFFFLSWQNYRVTEWDPCLSNYMKVWSLIA